MKLAVIGAGAIGLTHCQTIHETPGFELAGIADPTDQAAATAAQYKTRHYRDHRRLIEAEAPDGAIVATPNALHVSVGIDFLQAGIPILVEKPIAASTTDAAVLLDAARKTGVPVLVGHHRRHHPFVAKAHELISSGAIGRPVLVNVSYNLFKPASYFDAAWRTRPGGGGPLLINAIHEIDLLRYLYGEITAVSAVTSNTIRQFAVEDSAAVIFHFANGAVGAMTVSDTAVGPWSWDLASGDVPRFPKHPVTSHRFSGTEAALTLPRLELWRHDGEASWTTPMSMSEVDCDTADPFVRQLHHFADVIARRVEPLVSASEGAQNLAVLEAINQAAATGQRIDMQPVTG